MSKKKQAEQLVLYVPDALALEQTAGANKAAIAGYGICLPRIIPVAPLTALFHSPPFGLHSP